MVNLACKMKQKLSEAKKKFKRPVAEINWQNRKMINNFLQRKSLSSNKIVGTASTKDIDLVTTQCSTWYKHKMSLTNNEWTELKWVMFTKRRCIIHEDSSWVKIESEHSRRELRKHMEVMKHIGAMGDMESTAEGVVITYQKGGQEFPHMHEKRQAWEDLVHRTKMKSWGNSMKLIHHYGVRLTDWSSIRARMRAGEAKSKGTTGASSDQPDFADSSEDEAQPAPGEDEEAAQNDSNKEKNNSPGKAKRKKKASKPDKNWEQWNWKLGDLNVGDMNKRTSFKWKQLATIMDKNKLDGLAIQEHRLTDDSSFVAENLSHLKLYLTPCTKGDENGPLQLEVLHS